MAENYPPIHEVRVAPIDDDPEGNRVYGLLQNVPGVEGVVSAKVFAFQGVNPDQVSELPKLVVDQVAEIFTIDTPILQVDKVFRIGPKPGVMDPEGDSAAAAATTHQMGDVAAQTSIEYGIIGSANPKEVESVLRRQVMNVTTGRIIEGPLDTLTITGEPGPIREIPIIAATDEQLEGLSRDTLFLNLEEMHVVQKYFQDLGRNPTDLELEIFGAWWSEHCGHKTFKAIVIVDGIEKPPLYTRIKEAAAPLFGDMVLSAFTDNSGASNFYGGWAIVAKGETHNSPSAIAPKGGAETGVGGVQRDIVGTGLVATVIAGGDVFVLGSQDVDVSTLPPGILDPRYVEREVYSGVGSYGNPMGVPTINGSTHYTPESVAKPTVIVLAYGIMPKERVQKGVPQVGDRVVVVGGRTGRDGIHGATFSSSAMTERTATVNASSVQIGGPIQQRKMFDALEEAGDKGLVRAVNDCGAAGFSSAVGEMGKLIGIKVDISKVPLKYSGLSPWEIWMSESQERMALAIDPVNMADFLVICHKHGVEATDLGYFDGSRRMQVYYGGNVVANLDYDVLEDGLPTRVMHAHWERPNFDQTTPEMPENPTKWVDALKTILSHGDVCSKEPVVRTLDHTVRGATVVTPFSGKKQDGPNDAAVLQPIPGEPYGLVVAHGINPNVNRVNPFHGVQWAMAEAIANFVAVGGNPDEACFVENFVTASPNLQTMGALDMMVDGVVGGMRDLGVPVISGKDSLSSTRINSDGTVIEIPPILCMSIFGRIPDIQNTVTSSLKKPGSRLYLVGQLDKGMGGSIYYNTRGLVGNDAPKIDLKQTKLALLATHRAIKAGKILACHDVSEGGLAVTVAEMCFGGDMGAIVDLQDSKRPDLMLFNETAGVLVVEVADDETAEELFKDIPHVALGTTQSKKTMQVQMGGQVFFDASVDELKEVWQEPMRRVLNG